MNENYKGRRYLAGILMGATALYLLIIAWLTEGFWGGTDNIAHFSLAQYAFKDPSLFFDSWGRPLYTILSAPFAWFGLKGSQLFNVIIGISTAWLGYLTARRLHLEPSPMAIILVAFTPIFTVMLFTAYTEILFGFVMILTAWLFLSKKYLLSALVISFLPFARTEGYFLLPVYLGALLCMKQYRAAMLLPAGFVIITLAGIPFFKSFFWIIEAFPYTIGKTGGSAPQDASLFHYILVNRFIFGWPMAILILSGLLVMIFRIYQRNQVTRQVALQGLLVLAIPFLVYYTMHSFLYWQSMGGSTGRVRFIAPVAPVAAMIAMWAIDYSGRLPVRKWIKTLLYTFYALWIILAGYLVYPLPSPMGPEETAMKNAAAWLRNSPYSERNYYYTDLNLTWFMGYNRFDTACCRCREFKYYRGLDKIVPGELLIWESHFGPNECRVSQDSLMHHPGFRLLHHVEPVVREGQPIGQPYIILIFEKNVSGHASNNYRILDSLRANPCSGCNRRPILTYTFEKPFPKIDPAKVVTRIAFSGSHSFRMDSLTKFSPGLQRRIHLLTGVKSGLMVRASVWVYAGEPFDSIPGGLVISLTSKGKPINYRARRFETLNLPAKQWHQVMVTLPLSDIRSKDYTLSVYVWNIKKKTFYIDDLKAELLIPQNLK